MSNTLPKTSLTLDLQSIQKTNFTNEEIIELISFICSQESTLSYSDILAALHDKYETNLEMRPLNVEILSLREKFPVRVLYNYFSATQSEGYESLILLVIKGYQEDPLAALYVERLEEIFGKPDAEFIKDMLRYIETTQMDGTGINKIRVYYRNRLDQIADYAPIPKYVKEFVIDTDELPHLEDPEISEDMPSNLLAQLLIGKLDDLDILIQPTEDESSIDILTEKIDDMNEYQKQELIDSVKVNPEEIKSLQENPDIFRVYGPANPYPDTDYSLVRIQNEPDDYTDWRTFEPEGDFNVNVIYGGARMFTDMELEYDYENELPMEDWFVGYCYQCSSRIRAYHHAVREPNITGGWKGCFCSWPCVRKYIEMDTEHDPDLINMYQIKIALTKEMEQAIEETGIADRDYELIDPTESEGINSEEVDQNEADRLVAGLPKVMITESSTLPKITIPESSTLPKITIPESE